MQSGWDAVFKKAANAAEDAPVLLPKARKTKKTQAEVQPRKGRSPGRKSRTGSKHVVDIDATSAASSASNRSGASKKELFSLFRKPASTPAINVDSAVHLPAVQTRSAPSSFADAERRKRQRLNDYRGFHAPWPCADDIHVGYVPSESHPVHTSFRRKPDQPPTKHPPHSHFSWKDLTRAEHSIEPQRVPRYVELTSKTLESMLPEARTSHPLLSRIAELALDQAWRNSDNSELWTSKYGPRTTADVLGDASRESASTLKAWLLQLAIKGRSGSSPARRQIVRAIEAPKRHRRSREDDWIVNDDEIIDFERDPRLATPHASPSRTASMPNTPQSPPKSASGRLTNLILLRGPPGSGKTATVFAAARELGWEVFELSSNGRRSGRDLEAAFSGMTTNEHIHKGQQPPVGGTSPRRHSFFGPNHQSNGTVPKRKRAIVLSSDDVEVPEGGPPSKPSAASAPVRQSLILLEEVDVLFPEDRGFWEALVGLASRSRRPIIMTCCDASQLPLDQLALQATLSFEPPPRDIAMAYLQLIALAEGHIVPRWMVDELYRAHQEVEPGVPPSTIGLRPAPPTSRSRPSSTTDLRQALLQLQMLCQAERPYDGPFIDWSTSATSDEPLAGNGIAGSPGKQVAIRLAMAFHDLRSYTDAFVDRRPQMQVAACDTDEVPEVDIEVAYPLVVFPRDPLRFPCLPEFGREQDMASTIRACLAGRDDSVVVVLRQHDVPDADYEMARASFCQKADTATTILPLSAPLLPHASITTDYLPWLCAIVTADDVHEAAFDPDEPSTLAPGQSRRVMTRLSSKGYQRHLGISLDAAELKPEAADLLRSDDFGFPLTVDH